MRATWIGAIAALAAGCGAGTGAHHTTAGTGAVVTPSGHHLSKLSTSGTPRGEQTVRIEVVATSTRPTRQTLALVPVYIAGQGPFPFAAIGSPRPPASAVGTLHGPIGLLGSDVLSRYGKIAIDYDKGLLVLDPPVK